jgi:hypothetical protein
MKYVKMNKKMVICIVFNRNGTLKVIYLHFLRVIVKCFPMFLTVVL